MIYKRPQFVEYVISRVIIFALLILTTIVITISFVSPHNALFAMAILIVGFSILIYAIYILVLSIQRELLSINSYFDNIEDEKHLFTQELEDINQTILKILKRAKKREEIKQKYNAKIKLKNAQRGDMISAIAHEFRNPIASIMGYSQTLVEDKDIPTPIHDKFLNKIYNNGTKIEALLSRLVLWNKFESGEASLRPSQFGLYPLIEDIKASLEEKYPNRDIIIKGDRLKLEADFTLIEVVIKNLIENALKYSKDKVIVEITKQKISVTDSGFGIATSDINKITKKFYRSSTHSWDNSMGLGLSIVKSILQLHSSSLEIKSQEHIGSTFSFDISKMVVLNNSLDKGVK